MRDPNIFVRGFDRPNIWLGVETAASEARKRTLLLERIRNSERPGIVYTSTRKHAEEINGELNNVGIASACYHAGLGKREREAMQEQFMHDQVEVIVATSAFGMGVDKPDVRFVFHYEPPGSIDSYYQEIGRAGRDGKPASAVLFYRPNDLTIHKFFTGAGQVGRAEVARVLSVFKDGRGIETAEIQEKTGLSKTRLARALNRLEECGAILIDPRGTTRLVAEYNVLPQKTKEASQAQSALHEAELDRIEKMRLYADNLNCRRAYLIGYFGEDVPSTCGNCDNCQGAGTERARLIARTIASTNGNS